MSSLHMAGDMWKRKACARDPKGLRRRRLESRVLHYRFVATAGGGWGELWPIDPAGAASCTRSPTNPHTEAGRAARISGSVEGRVDRFTDHRRLLSCSSQTHEFLNME